MDDTRLELVLRVLDLQVVDVDGRRCGKADDIELGGEPLRVTALLIGAGVGPDRLAGPRGLARWWRRRRPYVLGGNVVRVPWEEVDEVTSAVHLRNKSVEYGLGLADDELRPVVARIPGAD